MEARSDAVPLSGRLGQWPAFSITSDMRSEMMVCLAVTAGGMAVATETVPLAVVGVDFKRHLSTSQGLTKSRRRSIFLRAKPPIDPLHASIAAAIW